MPGITKQLENIGNTFNISASDLGGEWRILPRHPLDMSLQSHLVQFALSAEQRVMFPAFTAAVRKLLLLPVGIAVVERSFSTTKRILCSDRCRLHPTYVCQLMQLSIEGFPCPDVRDATEA